MKLFLDTNILVDIAANRSPWVRDALILLQLASQHKVKLVAADYSFINVAYIIRKQLPQPELYRLLKDLNEYIEAATTGGQIILLALNAQWKDFEDCIQSLVAYKESADYIITRNEKDFSASPVPAMSPHDFLISFL